MQLRSRLLRRECSIMMNQPSHQNKKLTYRYGGIAILVGVVFLTIGLLITGGLLYVAVVARDEFAFWPRVLAAVAAAFPFAFALLGLLLTLSGHVVVVDPLNNQVRLRYGQWLAWKREAFQFEEFDSVELLRQVAERRATNDDGNGPTHLIRLRGPQQEIDVCSRRSYQSARAVAEQLAAALNIDLYDLTADEPAIRHASELDQSLRQRRERLGNQTSWPTLAASSRFQVFDQQGATVIHIPKPSKKMIREGIFGLVFLVVLYGISLGGTAFYLRNWLDTITTQSGTAWWHPIIYAAPIVALLYVILPGVVFLMSKEEVSISAVALKHTRRFAVGQWSRTLAGDRIEDVVIDGDDVIVRSDEKSLKLGVALEKKERQWLKKAVTHLLVHGPR